jgi:hypothetical protein
MSTVKQEYASQCRNCGRRVSRQLTVKVGATNPRAKRIRCKECRQINYCKVEDDGLDVL